MPGELDGAAEGALALRQLLITEFGYDADHVRCLTDRDASQDDIEGAFTKWLPGRKPGPDDSVLVYFAGHGCITDFGGFIMTQEASKDDPGISMEELLAQANKAGGPREVLLILDCCHSGSLARLPNDAAASGRSYAGNP